MKLIYVVVICLLSCLSFSVALGCMYTARDVGFVDIRPAPYHLYFYIRNNTPEDLVSTFRQISYAALMDSNIQVETINVDKRESYQTSEGSATDDGAMRYLEFWELQSFPAAVLVSPEGQSLVLPISIPDKPFKEAVWSAMESIVISPKRKEILSSIVDSYCVILLIQGGNAAANEKAQAAASGAIAEIKRMMSQMTKPIENPPLLIVIPTELYSQERVLLWSLGINGKGIDDPHLVLLYGKGRRIGPFFKGENITQNGIFNILSLIGSSCECGLDKGWMLDTMIPLRWDRKLQSEVVKQLGFDAESPMVKTEISQILSIGQSSEPGRSLESGKFEEYSEQVVELESLPTAATVSPAQFRQLVSPDPDTSKTVIRPYQKVLSVAIGMVVLILAGGVFIILQTRRRTS